MSTMDRAKRQLLRRLKELGGRLEEIEAELVTHSDPDWDDMAVKREGDEVLEALGESGQREIVQIRAALDRIAVGSYGTCVSCGEQIGPDSAGGTAGHAALPDLRSGCGKVTGPKDRPDTPPDAPPPGREDPDGRKAQPGSEEPDDDGDAGDLWDDVPV